MLSTFWFYIHLFYLCHGLAKHDGCAIQIQLWQHYHQWPCLINWLSACHNTKPCFANGKSLFLSFRSGASFHNHKISCWLFLIIFFFSTFSFSMTMKHFGQRVLPVLVVLNRLDLQKKDQKTKFWLHNFIVLIPNSVPGFVDPVFKHQGVTKHICQLVCVAVITTPRPVPKLSSQAAFNSRPSASRRGRGSPPCKHGVLWTRSDTLHQMASRRFSEMPSHFLEKCLLFVPPQTTGSKCVFQCRLHFMSFFVSLQISTAAKNHSPTQAFSPLFTASHAGVVFLASCWNWRFVGSSTWQKQEWWNQHLAGGGGLISYNSVLQAHCPGFQYNWPFFLMECSLSAHAVKRFLPYILLPYDVTL